MNHVLLLCAIIAGLHCTMAVSISDKHITLPAKGSTIYRPLVLMHGLMASAEAMVFGIPCIGFNLNSYKSYYPRGMIKVMIGDLNAFARAILELLNDTQKRDKIGKEALRMIEKNWNWDQRVDQLSSSLS